MTKIKGVLKLTLLQHQLLLTCLTDLIQDIIGVITISLFSYSWYEPNEKDQLRQELTKKFDYKHGQKCNGEKFQGDKNLI